MTASGVFENYRAPIEAELREGLAFGDLPLYAMQRYHMRWTDRDGRAVSGHGGKFLRSTLCLSACKAAGGDFNRALPAAAAVEFVHNFSLVHDDIEDSSEFRRHQPAVWRVWGTAHGINAGDSMCALAYLALGRLRSRDVPERKVITATEILSRTCLRLCEGQYRDIQYEQRTTITTDEYLDMVSGKTGALFGASTGIGALVGTEDETVIGALTDFGERLGIAFQILDDIQGIWGSLEKTGKAQYDDIVDRKKTLPVLYGFQQPVAGEQLARIYGKEAISQEDAEKVAAILRSCGALDYVCDAAERYLAQALETLVAIPGEAGRVELRDIAGSLRDGLTV